MTITLRLRDVAVGFPGHPALAQAMDLELRSGEAVAVMGPSGGGKSTLLKTIAGLIPLHSGHLSVLGHDAPDRPPRGQVGYVPQRLGLVRHGSVLDNVQHGALHESTWWQSLLHRVPEGATKRSWEALEAVGLAHKAHEPIVKLSGGQQRRIAVARTLVQRPRLLLADEFLGELDSQTASTVADTVHRLQREHDTTVLMVEHQYEQARLVADRIFRLADGALTEVTDA